MRSALKTAPVDTDTAIYVHESGALSDLAGTPEAKIFAASLMNAWTTFLARITAVEQIGEAEGLATYKITVTPQETGSSLEIAAFNHLGETARRHTGRSVWLSTRSGRTSDLVPTLKGISFHSPD